jgi:hypothetical protein
MTNASLRNLKKEADETKRLRAIQMDAEQITRCVIDIARRGDTSVSVPLRQPIDWYASNFPFIADKLYESFPEASIQLRIQRARFPVMTSVISLAELCTLKTLLEHERTELSVLVDWSGEAPVS